MIFVFTIEFTRDSYCFLSLNVLLCILCIKFVWEVIKVDFNA